MSVPRTIHQIWLGKTMPDREEQWCSEMREMNPNWEHRLHRDEILEKYGSDIYVRALRDLGKPTAFIADRLRMLLLREYGGIYLDCDCQPVGQLDSLSDVWDGPATFVAGFRSPDRPDVALHRGVTLLDNTFLASAPNSRMCQRILSLWRPQNVVVDGHATGVEIMRNCHSDVVLLNHRYFYATQMLPESVVLHDAHNLASWVAETKAEQRKRFSTV